MKKAGKTIEMILVLMMLLSLTSAWAEEGDGERRMLPIYYYTVTDTEELPVAFFHGQTDIPYCSGATVAWLLEQQAKKSADRGYVLEYGYTTYRDMMEANWLALDEDDDPDCEVFYIRRENGAFVLFDATNDKIWFNDRDLFGVYSYAVSGGDLVYEPGVFYNEDGTIQWNEQADKPYVNLYHRVKGNSYKREGDVTSIDLGDYDIHIEEYEQEYYLPLATVSDLILRYSVTFNGEALFAMRDGLPDRRVENEDGQTMEDLYYSTAPRARSEALAQFTYHELCLSLDQNYGLKEEHGVVDGFDHYFRSAELTDNLTSTDPAVFTDAMMRVLDGYFGDSHSALDVNSPYAGLAYEAENDNISISLRDGARLEKRFVKAREEAGITSDFKILEGYEEIGDTAFVTFDHFVGESVNYYNRELWDHFRDVYMNDTISLVIYAHDRIHRQDSPVRKVVIDLSCNSGGSLDACVYIASWVLGAAQISIENVNTGAQYTTTYWSDVNLNGECDLDDELGVDQLEVYCLVNGNSFSCGNLLPTLFKQDGRVTLIGQTTGGGACVVRETSAADGTTFSISNYYRLCTVKNGSFYSIDRGVEPDIPLRKPESFYDRAAMVEWLGEIR